MVTIDNKKLLVITAFMKVDSCDLIEGFETGAQDFYCPSIFFYNLSEQRIDWIIEGAEIFIGLYEENKVYYMTNSIWQKMNE